jgi:hypothetical protein
VSWSKNVLDERRCPDQLLLGAEDSDFCVLIALGCYLESHVTRLGRKYLFGENNGDTEPKRLGGKYYRILKACWRNEDFQELLAQTRGSVGTHSLRKFPATWCSEHGASQDDVEIRGRWKGSSSGRVVSRYINVEQLPTDAKMASTLAVGGPVRYKLKSDSHASPAFLLDSVVPNMSAHYTDESNHIATVMGPAVLYAAHVPALSHLFKPQVLQRIQSAYAGIRQQHPADYNPVEKVPLHVYRVENNTVIEELTALPPDTAGGDGQQLQAAQAVHAQRDNMQSMLLSMHRLTQQQAQHHQQQMVCVYIYVISCVYIVSLQCTNSI